MNQEQNLLENHTEDEPVADYVCKACGQADIDYSENANSLLCRACRERHIHYPVSKFLIILSIALIILAAIAFRRFPKVLGYYRIYENAEQMAAEGKGRDAINGLYKVLEQYPDSEEVAIRLTDIAMEREDYDSAAEVISNYLSGKKISGDAYTRLNHYIDVIDRYYDTCDVVEEMHAKLDSSLSYEEVAEAMTEQLKSRLKVPNQNRTVLYYYLAMFSQNTEDAKDYMRKCIEEDDKFSYAKVELANRIRREGKLNDAKMYYKQVIRADIYNFQALRGLAIINLLEGEKAEGLKLASQAYKLEPEGNYIMETYLIALKENKKDADAEALLKEYLSKGKEIDSDTQGYLDGTITLNDYYIESREDV